MNGLGCSLTGLSEYGAGNIGMTSSVSAGCDLHYVSTYHYENAAGILHPLVDGWDPFEAYRITSFDSTWIESYHQIQNPSGSWSATYSTLAN